MRIWIALLIVAFAALAATLGAVRYMVPDATRVDAAPESGRVTVMGTITSSSSPTLGAKSETEVTLEYAVHGHTFVPWGGCRIGGLGDANIAYGDRVLALDETLTRQLAITTQNKTQYEGQAPRLDDSCPPADWASFTPAQHRATFTERSVPIGAEVVVSACRIQNTLTACDGARVWRSAEAPRRFDNRRYALFLFMLAALLALLVLAGMPFTFRSQVHFRSTSHPYRGGAAPPIRVITRRPARLELFALSIVATAACVVGVVALVIR